MFQAEKYVAELVDLSIPFNGQLTTINCITSLEFVTSPFYQYTSL